MKPRCWDDNEMGDDEDAARRIYSRFSKFRQTHSRRTGTEKRSGFGERGSRRQVKIRSK
jgi:hypothetical protein